MTVNYDTHIEDIRTEDKQNPYLIAEALENSLRQSARRSVIVMMPCLILGVGGMVAAGMGAGTLMIWAAAAIMTVRTVKQRQIEIPNLRDHFNTLAAGITEAKPRAELRKISTLLATDHQSAVSWLREIDPRRHPLRTPFVALILGWGLLSGAATMLPLAAFVMAANMLDSHGDHISNLRDQTAQARGSLRPWRTGLRFG